MPKIRPHHHPDHPLASETDYSPVCGWPDDTSVQWGGGGLVLGAENYITAFFEAFPAGAGFIRGEGETIEDAERQAFAQFQREHGCQHVWGRRGYTNSGAKCIKCDAFHIHIFKPITKLGSWRAPLGYMNLSSIISGWIRPSAARGADNAEHAKHNRLTWLRARWNGIDLPPMPSEPMTSAQFMGSVIDPYRTGCREAVAAWIESDRCTLSADERRSVERTIDGHRKSDARIIARASDLSKQD